jgi:hypothetical protein
VRGFLKLVLTHKGTPSLAGMVFSLTTKDHIMKIGKLALEYCGKALQIRVMRTAAGWYIGTANDDGTPCSRESNEYFRSQDAAQDALDTGNWTQKINP